VVKNPTGVRISAPVVDTPPMLAIHSEKLTTPYERPTKSLRS
jgi:hypothetical protein